MIVFNCVIIDECCSYLIEECIEVEVEIKGIMMELNMLGKCRLDLLVFFSVIDVFVKYK